MKLIFWIGIAIIVMGALDTLCGFGAPTIGPSGVAAVSINAVSWSLRFFGIGLVLTGVAFSRLGLTRGSSKSGGVMRPVYWLGVAAVIIAILVIYFSFLVTQPPFAGSLVSTRATGWGLGLSGIGLVLTGAALLRLASRHGL